MGNVTGCCMGCGGPLNVLGLIGWDGMPIA